MNRDDVVAVATHYAIQEGYDVSQCDVSARQSKGDWEVSFRSMSSKPAPGDFYTVYVDDVSKTATRIVPGK